MQYRQNVRDFHSRSHAVTIIEQVDRCPICHHTGRPSLLDHRVNLPVEKLGSKLWISCQCSNGNCQAMFIMELTAKNMPDFNIAYYFDRFYPTTFKKHEFESQISNVSPTFEAIYNEALEAENYGLKNICGPGYRKSLEFLIKDYCIKKYPDKEAEIRKNQLGKVIQDYVDGQQVKVAASRAAWLGNDETHYDRVWATKDVQDLKKLIQLSVYFITSEELVKEYESEMPQKPK